MMSAQLISIIIMFISGIAVGAVIDCTRTILQNIPVKRVRYIKTFIEWSIWLALGVSTFYFMFLIKGGQWRVVDPLAQIAGIITYEFMLQRIFRFLGRLFVTIVIKPIFYLVQLVIRFIQMILRWITGFFLFVTRPIYKLFKKILLKTF